MKSTSVTEAMLVAAMACFPAGMGMISAGQTFEGISVVLLGILIVFARGYIKNN